MIGRVAQWRPWLPRQVARYIATGISIGAPALCEQFNLVDSLYDEMLNHHGAPLDRRRARKHLGWAFDAAVATVLKHHRGLVLTPEEPVCAGRLLAEAYHDFSLGAAA
jgi:tRNA-dihydrouridine synthase